MFDSFVILTVHFLSTITMLHFTLHIRTSHALYTPHSISLYYLLRYKPRCNRSTSMSHLAYLACLVCSSLRSLCLALCSLVVCVWVKSDVGWRSEIDLPSSFECYEWFLVHVGSWEMNDKSVRLSMHACSAPLCMSWMCMLFFNCTFIHARGAVLLSHSKYQQDLKVWSQ